MDKLKVSILTVSYNREKTIEKTIKSVLSQTYQNIEYIMVDGASTDGTGNIIRSYGNKIDNYISEPDQGIYDAMNKGMKLASGDIVGILNADDVFYDNSIVEKIVKAFNEQHIDAIYGDVQFFNPENPHKVIRYYSSKRFLPEKFKFGIMPAHPSFYARRELFDKFGYYKTDYKIAADFELLLRLIYKNNIKCQYKKFPFVTMRMGGISNRNLKSNWILNKEIMRACKENGLKTNYLYIYSKYFRKIFEFFGNN